MGAVERVLRAKTSVEAYEAALLVELGEATVADVQACPFERAALVLVGRVPYCGATAADVLACPYEDIAWRLALCVPHGTPTAADVAACRFEGAAEHLAHTAGLVTELDDIGEFGVETWPGWLKVGCEARRFEDWVLNAEHIDALHGAPGLHHETRALALELALGLPPGTLASFKRLE